MQRCQLLRKLVKQVAPVCLLRPYSYIGSMPRFQSLESTHCSTLFSTRFHADNQTSGEEATRTGQYLLNKDDVLTRVLEVIKNFEKVDASKVTPQSHFVNDLGLNSLDVVEVVFAIEQEFILDIPDHDAEKIQSIPDAVEYISQNPMAK
ncbi:putative acyl carrier protein, precursor [Trypanosoma vivax]|nr:putative acyl carrier protein, precursor [Trypanosoma vivax]